MLIVDAARLFEQISTRIEDSIARLVENRFNYDGLKIYMSGCEDWAKDDRNKIFQHIRGCKGQPKSSIKLGSDSKDVNLVVGDADLEDIR